MQLLHQLLKGVYTLKHSLNCVISASPRSPRPAASVHVSVRAHGCQGSQPCARPFMGTLAMGGWLGQEEGVTMLHQVHFSLVVCDPFTAERLRTETALNDSLHLFTEPLVFVISFSFLKIQRK